MASRFRLSSLAVCAVSLFLSAPVMAQEPFPPPADLPTPSPASKAPEPRQEDCKRLPGGKAPINRLARLEGGISVRNLELTYFGKPLFEFTDEDYAFLKALWPICKTFDEETAPLVVRRLKGLIDDAKAVRQDSLDWIKQTEKNAKALKPGQDSIETIHDLWQQMLNREFQMTSSDMAYISDVLGKRRDELYTQAEGRQRTLVSPFDPGPPEVRSLRGTGG